MDGVVGYTVSLEEMLSLYSAPLDLVGDCCLSGLISLELNLLKSVMKTKKIYHLSSASLGDRFRLSWSISASLGSKYWYLLAAPSLVGHTNLMFTN